MPDSMHGNRCASGRRSACVSDDLTCCAWAMLAAGDPVKEDDIIAQIETDKVTIDVKYTIKESGVVTHVLIAPGDTVSVGQLVASVDVGKEAAAAAAPAAAPASQPAPAAAKPAPAAAPATPKPAPAPAAPAAKVRDVGCQKG